MYNFKELLVNSSIIGLGTSAGTFMGTMLYPNISNDWRDLATIGIISVIISYRYANQFFEYNNYR